MVLWWFFGEGNYILIIFLFQFYNCYVDLGKEYNDGCNFERIFQEFNEFLIFRFLKKKKFLSLCLLRVLRFFC